jgi:hypothetical protein
LDIGDKLATISAAIQIILMRFSVSHASLPEAARRQCIRRSTLSGCGPWFIGARRLGATP